MRPTGTGKGSDDVKVEYDLGQRHCDQSYVPSATEIYVGEPEPLEELADLVGGLLGGLGRVADGLLGPAPVPIPIPVEDEREQAPEPGPGTDPYKYPGTY